jgi:hypothetical protein
MQQGSDVYSKQHTTDDDKKSDVTIVQLALN